MFLIVGLGNPGKKYQNTRHNIGARLIQKMESLDLPDVILVKPTTFMNESGKAVKKLIVNCKLKIENLMVIHDDIDLPIGKIKISKDGGSGGHKGIASIIESLKTKDFIRLRIGIQPKSGKPAKVEDFVLKKFTKTEEKILEEVIKKAIGATELLIKDGAEKAMNEFNR
ncbi:MAG: aminoacyl-tRNA hydrolase [Patescibacteria group bacterium]